LLPVNGHSQPPEWLTTEWLLAAFGKQKANAKTKYRDFVADGKMQPSPWALLKNQVFLGIDTFVERLQHKIEKGKDLSEILKSQKKSQA
jgi:putative transposase